MAFTRIVVDVDRVTDVDVGPVAWFIVGWRCFMFIKCSSLVSFVFDIDDIHRSDFIGIDRNDLL